MQLVNITKGIYFISRSVILIFSEITQTQIRASGRQATAANISGFNFTNRSGADFFRSPAFLFLQFLSVSLGKKQKMAKKAAHKMVVKFTTG